MLPASSSSSSETVYSGSRSSGNEVVTSVLLLMTASSGWTKEPHVPADVEALPSPLSPAAVLNPRPLQYSSQLSLLSTLRPNLSPVDINESGPGLLSASSARLDIDGDERSTGSSSYRVNQTSISSSFSVSVSSDHLSEFSCESLSAGGLSNKEASASKPMGSSSCCRPPNAYEKVKASMTSSNYSSTSVFALDRRFKPVVKSCQFNCQAISNLVQAAFERNYTYTQLIAFCRFQSY